VGQDSSPAADVHGGLLYCLSYRHTNGSSDEPIGLELKAPSSQPSNQNTIAICYRSSSGAV